MSYYLGFDGGGSKTECVVLDDAGRMVAQDIAGPSNPLRVGFDQAYAALDAAAATTLAKANLEARQVRAVCAGLAGAGRPSVVRGVMAFLEKTFPNSIVHATTDLEVALEAAAGPGAGIVLIAGTGSAAFGRNAGGQVARAGGHGPWIGDEGSAFDIGRRAVAAVARSRDLAAADTLLAETIPAALECSTWEELIERVAGNPDEVLPRIFPVVVEAADAGDNAAREILSHAALGLASLATAVIRRLGLTDEEFVLAKTGGVFGRSRLLDATLGSALSRAAPRANIGPLGVSPAVGAARLAERLMRLQPGGAGSSSAKHGPQS
jgi:N-acetylglucosamine kinase-like BadF-type ATPase